MNTVEPIKDIGIVLDIADYLLSSTGIYAERNYMIWLTGIYLGLRVSDILLLKVRDVKEKERIYIREKKTGKENYIEMPLEYKIAIDNYIKGKKDYEYLFTSRERKRKLTEDGEIIELDKPISRQHAYRILKNAASKFCNTRVATHTMRKTFGYFLYMQTKDILLVKEILCHSHVDITRRYIGLTQEMKAKAIIGMSYKR